MKYVNTTYATKTFYGVEFKPGEEHEVPGYINADGFFRSDILNLEKADKPKAESKEEQATEPVAETEKPTKTRKSTKTETSEKGDE